MDEGVDDVDWDDGELDKSVESVELDEVVGSGESDESEDVVGVAARRLPGGGRSFFTGIFNVRWGVWVASVMATAGETSRRRSTWVERPTGTRLWRSKPCQSQALRRPTRVCSRRRRTGSRPGALPVI